MKTFGKRSFVMALFMSIVTLGVFAQAPTDRNKIKNAIKNWGTCRNVAITRTFGDIAIANKNDYSAKYVPNDLINKLRELYDNESYIDDITLTESGKWVVLYDLNDAAWSAGVPQGMVDAIMEFHENEYYVTSISFNDDMDWAVVSRQEIKTSSSELTNWLLNYSEQHGQLWSVTIGEDGIFAVYENGYATKGELPDGLMDAIHETSLDYYRVKFAGESWFFADEEGQYQYSM